MNGFTIYEEYFDLITLLPTKEEQSELVLAICEYMFLGEEPKLNESQMKIFRNLKRPLDKSKKRSISGSKTKSNTNQNENKIILNQNQNEIKIETKQNQNEIKMKSNQNQNKIKTKSKSKQNDNKTKTHQDVNVNVNDNVYVDNLEKIGYEEEKPLEGKTFYAEFVSMTDAEYKKLVSSYGEKFTKACIEILDNYKGSSGKKYKSDYRAILTWVIEEARKKQKPEKRESSNPFYELGKDEGIF